MVDAMFATGERKQGLEGKEASPSGQQVFFQSRDPDEVAQGLSFLGAEVVQLGHGPFQGSVQLVQLGPVAAIRVSLNRAVHTRGFRPNTYGFDLFTSVHQAGKMQGRPLKTGQLSVIGPPGEWDHITLTPYSEHFNVCVDADSLLRYAEILHGVDLEERLGCFRVVRPDPATLSDLEAHLRRLFAQVRSRPTLLDQPEERRQLERSCIDKLLQTLFSGALAPEEPRRLACHVGVVRRAVDFMLARLDKNLFAEDVCKEVGISERTLRYAFQDQFGVGPMAYFKKRQLAAVRHELRLAAADPVTVHEIARRWGFQHTGNFAADYRRLFGELPSETLDKG
jgi:AraC family ethanolamine operon transcriptional activator